MDTTRILRNAVRDEVKRTILREAINRYNHELMDDSERMLLLDRIKQLRRAVETDADTVDAIHSGLDQL